MSETTNERLRNFTSDRQWFVTTEWAVVLSTANKDASQAQEALEKLCQTYWTPTYNYLRRWGIRIEEAEDLTQAFLVNLLKKNFWARADREKGRFRAFLLKALRQYVADQRARGNAAKRGGGAPIVPLNEEIAESQFEGANQSLNGEQQFDLLWATTVLAQAREKLRLECVATDKIRLFDRANVFADKDEATAYATLGPELDMSVNALKTAISRLRYRYCELVRHEVAQTVSSPAEVDAEIRHLLDVIGG